MTATTEASAIRSPLRAALLLAGVVGLLLGGASLAWACTPNAYIFVSPNHGPAGSQTTVEGGEWVKNDQVEIRWGEDGEVLTTVTATSDDPTDERGNFTVSVTIPEDAAKGEELIVAEGVIDGYSQAKYEVVSPGEQPSNQNDPGTNSTQGGPNGNEDSDPDGTQQTSTGPNNDDQSDSAGDTSTGAEQSNENNSNSTSQTDGSGNNSQATSGGQSGADRTGGSEPVAMPSGSGAADASGSDDTAAQDTRSAQPNEEPAPSPATDQGRQPVGGEQPRPEQQAPASPSPTDQTADDRAPAPDGPTPTSSRQAPEASEPAGDNRDRGGPETAAEQPDPAEESEGDAAATGEAGRPDTNARDRAQTPSARSGSDDLWSGFATGEQPSLTPGTDSPAGAGQPGGAGQQLLVAAGLFGAGLLLLTTGSAVAIRRKRAPARAHRRAD